MPALPLGVKQAGFRRGGNCCDQVCFTSRRKLQRLWIPFRQFLEERPKLYNLFPFIIKLNTHWYQHWLQLLYCCITHSCMECGCKTSLPVAMRVLSDMPTLSSSKSPDSLVCWLLAHLYNVVASGVWKAHWRKSCAVHDDAVAELVCFLPVPREHTTDTVSTVDRSAEV